MNKQEFIDGVNAEFDKMREEYVDLGNRFEIPFGVNCFLELSVIRKHSTPDQYKKRLYDQTPVDAAQLIFESLPDEGGNKILSTDQFFESINNESVDKEDVTDTSGIKVVSYKNMGYTCVSDKLAGLSRNLNTIRLEDIKDFELKFDQDEDKCTFQGQGIMVVSY